MNFSDKKSIDPREIELKLQLPPGSRAVLEACSVFVAAKSTQLHQVTTYFDTPDRVLERAGLTLRVRRIGNTHVQNVKSRASDREVAADRGEWEWRISQDMPALGKLAKIRQLAKIAGKVKGSLEPVFVTDIRRTVRLLHVADDTIVEAAIDEGSIEAGSKREAVSELELKLKCGRIGPVYQFAAELRGIAPLWISSESKAARGWHLRTGQTEEAQRESTPELGKRTRAADGFHKIIAETLGHLVANIGPALRGDAEGVHQMRKALRASRAALKLFEPHLDATVAGRFNAVLLRLGQIFGTARDWDVLCLETLPAAKTDLPADQFPDLSLAAKGKRQVAHAAVDNALRSREFTLLVLGLAAWAEAGAEQPHSIGDDRMDARLGSLAPLLLDRVANKAKKRGRHPGRLSVAELHALRKSLKKLGCDVKCFRGLYRRHAADAYHSRCEDLEKILGVANDAIVTRRLALSLATARRPNLTKSVDALAQWSKHRRRKVLLGLKGALKAFRATPAFWSK